MLEKVEQVKALLGAGANPDLGNNEGQPPLFSGCMSGNLEIVRLLVHAGANTNWRDKDGDGFFVDEDIPSKGEIEALLRSGKPTGGCCITM